jgi:hypothetical protein
MCVPSCLPQHVHHLCLKYRIHSLDGYARTGLRHSKDINHAHCVVVDELAEHKTHDLHRHTRATVPQHLEQRKRRNVDGFRVVDQVGVLRGTTHAAHALGGGEHPA